MADEINVMLNENREPISASLSVNENISGSLSANENINGSLMMERVKNIPTYLPDLGDVEITEPTDGQGLIYDASAEKWVNGSGKSGATSLSELTDVSIDSPQTTDYLKYSYNDKKWTNSPVSYYDLINPPRNLSNFNNDVAVPLVKEFPTSFDKNYSIIQYAGADEDKFGHFYKANSDNVKYYFKFEDGNKDTIYLECGKDNLFEPIGETKLCILEYEPVIQSYLPRYIHVYDFYFEKMIDIDKGRFISAINIKRSEYSETYTKYERPDGIYDEFNPSNDKIIGDITWEEISIQDVYTKSEIDNALGNKQNKLTAGANITIVNDVISATGGGEGGTTDYTQLTNKPSINGFTLNGSVTSEDLGIANKSTSLSGYGITDAYTKIEIDEKIGDVEALLAAL